MSETIEKKVLDKISLHILVGDHYNRYGKYIYYNDPEQPTVSPRKLMINTKAGVRESVFADDIVMYNGHDGNIIAVDKDENVHDIEAYELIRNKDNGFFASVGHCVKNNVRYANVVLYDNDGLILYSNDSYIYIKDIIFCTQGLAIISEYGILLIDYKGNIISEDTQYNSEESIIYSYTYKKINMVSIKVNSTKIKFRGKLLSDHRFVDNHEIENSDTIEILKGFLSNEIKDIQ